MDENGRRGDRSGRGSRGARGRWASRARFGALVTAVVAAAALGLSACGGAAPDASGVAHLGATASSGAHAGSAGTTHAKSGTSTASVHTDAVKFSKCMRSHGLTNFPDPSPGGGFVFNAATGAIDPNSPRFRAAQHACQRYMPKAKLTPAASAKDKARLLKYSNCMRAHGVTNFPDPSSRSGGGWGFNFTDTSLNPSSPTYQAAVRACQHLLGGQGAGPCTGGGSRRSRHLERRC